MTPELFYFFKPVILYLVNSHLRGQWIDILKVCFPLVSRQQIIQGEVGRTKTIIQEFRLNPLVQFSRTFGPTVVFSTHPLLPLSSGWGAGGRERRDILLGEFYIDMLWRTVRQR